LQAQGQTICRVVLVRGDGCRGNFAMSKGIDEARSKIAAIGISPPCTKSDTTANKDDDSLEGEIPFERTPGSC